MTATGARATQSQQCFNAPIRKALEESLAESRRHIRPLAALSVKKGAGTASVYAEVDQTYVNNITSPRPTSSGWSRTSGSAGSSVPGQWAQRPGV